MREFLAGSRNSSPPSPADDGGDEHRDSGVYGADSSVLDRRRQDDHIGEIPEIKMRERGKGKSIKDRKVIFHQFIF